MLTKRRVVSFIRKPILLGRDVRTVDNLKFYHNWINENWASYTQCVGLCIWYTWARYFKS